MTGFRRVTWHLGDELDDSRMDQTIDRLGDSFGKMVDALGGMGAGVEELQDATVELYDLMNDLEKAHDREKQQKLVGKIGKKLQEINEIMEELEKIGVSGGIDSGTFEAFREARQAINSDQVPDEMAEEIVSELLATMEEQLSEMSGSIQGDLSTTMELLDGMQGMQSSIYQLSNDVSVILNETSDMIFGLTDLLKPMTQSLETFDKTLEESSDHLNDGARLTLKGMTQMLNDLSDALDKTDDLQAQKDIISGIIRDDGSVWTKIFLFSTSIPRPRNVLSPPPKIPRPAVCKLFCAPRKSKLTRRSSSSSRRTRKKTSARSGESERSLKKSAAPSAEFSPDSGNACPGTA